MCSLYSRSTLFTHLRQVLGVEIVHKRIYSREEGAEIDSPVQDLTLETPGKPKRGHVKAIGIGQSIASSPHNAGLFQ